MQKERRILSVSSNRPRVSPYPLRSCRNNKQKGPESSFQSEGARQWEDVRCVICMEPPHNAVLLHCSSFSKGCRPYMCDTSVRHSNCFKQYRRNNTNRYNSKTLNCPLCRGEVYETKKVTSARRFMNAKPRCCSMDDCEFSGSYSQLKSHLKTEHPGFTPPKIDSWKQGMWEQMEREAEYMELLSAAEIQHRRWAAEERQEGGHPVPVIQVSFDGIMRGLLGGAVAVQDQTRNHLSAASFSAFMPRLEIRTTMLHAHIFPVITKTLIRSVRYVAKLAPLVSLSIVLDGFQGVLSGIARGCGWQHIGAYINLGAFFYLWGTPIAAALAFGLHLKSVGLWLGIQAGAVLLTLLLALFTAFTNWEKQARRVRERVAMGSLEDEEQQ